MDRIGYVSFTIMVTVTMISGFMEGGFDTGFTTLQIALYWGVTNSIFKQTTES